MKFYNREKELNALEKLYSLIEKGHFCVITGQRRVGKTELLKNFIQQKEAIYFLVDKRKGNTLLKEFVETLKEKFPDMIIGELDWLSFIELLFKIAENRKIIVIFDEFQYFNDVDPSIFSLFQKALDKYQKTSKILLIVCGSYIGLMKRIFYLKDAPLYGRKTSEMHILPLKYKHVRKILDDFNVKDESKKIEFYSVFGGIPRYYVLMEKFKVNDLFQSLDEFLFSEPKVLSNEINDILMLEFKSAMPTYYEIISAIALGKCTLKEISDYTKIDINSVPKYLDILENFYGFIERKVPVTEYAEKSKKGRYFLKDMFFRFWFRFIYRNMSYYEIGNYEYIKEKIKSEFDSYVGLAYEDVCKEFLIELNNRNDSPLKFKFSKIGKWWNRKGDEIDIVAINNETKEILFGECKWQESKVGFNVLNKLKEKANMVEWNSNNRKEYFAIFSKSGFEKELIEFCKKEKNLLLFDLNDLKNMFES